MDNDTNQPELASFGARLTAMIADMLLLSFAISPILLAIFGAKQISEAEFRSIIENQGIQGIVALYSPAEIVVTNVLFLGITAFCWVKFSGTPVKRLLGIRVVDAKTGKNPTPIQAVLRCVGYFVSYLPMCLGFFWALIDKNNQAWHDKIAGTLVIKDSARGQNHRFENHSTQHNKDDTFTA